MTDFRNVSGIASKFMNVSIGNIFRMATKTQQLVTSGSTLFTNADYQSLRNPFDDNSDVSLSTLCKYGIIEIAEARTTDVAIQIHKTYYYRINFTHAAQLLTFAEIIASVGED